MTANFATRSSVISLGREQWTWLGSFFVLVVYGWVIMCAQPSDAWWQVWCGAVNGVLAVVALNAFIELVRHNSADWATSLDDPLRPWMFGGLVVGSLAVGGLLGYASGQLGMWLGWNGWKVYVVNTWSLGASVIFTYLTTINLRGRACLRRTLELLKTGDYHAAARIASIGLLYDLGQPCSHRFSAGLRYVRGRLLLDVDSLAAAEDFRRLARDGVMPDEIEPLMRDACEQMAAQCKEVGSGDEEDGALDVADRFEQWLKQRSAAENEIEAALLRELNSHWVMIILVAACLAYFFFFKR
jgi:hypothetical protein